MAVELRVNGAAVAVESDPDTPLLYVLRDELGLTGTKYGCGAGSCGACVVLVNGDAVLKKSAAASRCLEALGGYWRLLGLGIGMLPAGLRDAAYDLVGAVRYRLFGRTDALCPILPAQLRDRVLP